MDALREVRSKKHSPAALRNREAIGQVLSKELPAAGNVLEVASGTGEHAVYFTGLFPRISWQPSDPEPEALQSISAYRADVERENLKQAIMLDARAPETWPAAACDAIVCINMIHVSPWEACEGLFAGAARLLASGAPLILYGPYLEDDVETAPSNLAFDESLKSRDPQWGLRELSKVDAVAARNGFTRSARHTMPANNLTVVYRRS